MSEQAVETTIDTSSPADLPDDTPEAIFEAVASQMGWSPKDKWRGDPDKHIDAKAFILNTPKAMKAAKSQGEMAARAAERALEKARTDAIADARAEVAAAAAAGDADAADVAAQKLERASQKPDAVVVDFAKRNPWYGTDTVATQVAIAAAQKVADSQGSVADQVAAGEKEVRKRFPELFDDAPVDEPTGRTPPAVQGGQRTAAPAPRKKGWSDVPQAARASWPASRLKKFNLTEAEFAESYFKENA